MQKLKLIFVLAIGMVAFQACNNDDEGANEGTLEGTWDVTGLTFDLTINGAALSDFLPQAQADIFEDLYTSAISDSFEGATIEFKSDGTYTSSESDGNRESGSWSINSDGTVLTLDGGTAEEFAFDIKNSTSSSLVLAYSETDASQDLDQDGNNDELTISFELDLSK